MGYTHYFTQRQDLTDAQWRIFRAHMEALYGHHLAHPIPASRINAAYAECPVVLSNREQDVALTADALFTDDDQLWFNGDASAGLAHETLVISRRIPAVTDRNRCLFDANGGYFEFCKTAFKPYDVFVVAALILLHTLCPGCFDISSDGDTADWQSVLDYMQPLFPHLTLSLPDSLRVWEP